VKKREGGKNNRKEGERRPEQRRGRKMNSKGNKTTKGEKSGRARKENNKNS